MNTQKRFALFFSVVLILLFVTIFSSYLLYKNRQLAHLANEYQKKEYNADVALKLQSKPMLKITLDYTLWDEMIGFIKHPDVSWAKDNIDPLLQTTGFNYIWIFNTSGVKVYERKGLGSLSFSNPFPTNTIHRILDSIPNGIKQNCSYFAQNNNQIIEISGASVHSSSDMQRLKRPGGYIFLGRVLNKDYLHELSIITDSQIALISDTLHKNKSRSHQITIFKQLYDWNNKAIATIQFSSDDKFIQEEDNYNLFSIIIFVIAIGLIITSSFFYVKTHITNPLTAISKSLNTEDKTKIDHLLVKTDEFGQMARLINSFFDQKKTLENDYQNLIEHTNSLVCETDIQGVFTFSSPASITILGYEPHELIGKSALKLIPDTEAKRLSEHYIYHPPAPGSGFRETCHFRHRRGDWRWVDLSVTFYEKGPNDIRIITIATDITERKLAEEALKQREEENRALLDAIPDLFFRIRKDGVILNFKAPDESLLFTSPETFLGRNLKEVLPPEVYAPFFEIIDNKLKNNQIHTFEYKLFMNNGPHYYEARIVSSSANELFAIIRDISERKNAEILLQESEIQLTELNHTKDKFFSIIAHDLKGPLTSLLGLTEQVIENFETFERKSIKKYFQIINKSALNSYKLLENLLEWSRAQTGKIEYQPIIINLKDIIHENIAMVEEQASQKYIKINAVINDNYSIFGDRQMINSILRNLLVNAIKFTSQKGQITVSAVEKIDHIEITVKDTGVGISKDELKKLFRLDCKYSTLGTDDEQGTGLGLILCKEFVEKNGGKIWVESELNHGSDFKFTLTKIDVANLS
ncbi:MAG: PAS domain S-box protein [Bacteroidota bacterium]|nr:PAS domain S-box protein [Bacteroidota bacterium]